MFNDFFPAGAHLTKIVDGLGWAEGPLWLPNANCLIFSDIPGNRIIQWSVDSGVSIFRDPSGRANGNALDVQGRILTCEHETRRVTRTEQDGSVTVLVERYRGMRFNSPNDLIACDDGKVLFTDPDYGLISVLYPPVGEREIGANNVYCYDPETGQCEILLSGFDKPNGLALSPAGDRLYVADSGRTHRPDGPHHVRTFVFCAGRVLGECGPTIEIRLGVPDGLKADISGNLWISARDGVYCHDREGKFLGMIAVPETVANLTFGGKDNKTLFIAASTSVYMIDLQISGAVGRR